MKKVFAVELFLILLLVGVMTVLLYQKNARPDVTEADVKEMVTSVAVDTAITPGGPLRLRRSFGLNSADHDLVVYYMPTDSLNVDEFLLIRTDEGQISDVLAAMEARIESQLNAFENYGDHQTELLKKAEIHQFGNYICLIIAEHPEVWLDAVKTLLEV
ncbi:MAG: DUF4358 domain-containing protein [Lachnospiraceae bacterium]|nr:DUF4358 domain-containing protein [Lachnospiraceae bacterium]